MCKGSEALGKVSGVLGPVGQAYSLYSAIKGGDSKTPSIALPQMPTQLTDTMWQNIAPFLSLQPTATPAALGNESLAAVLARMRGETGSVYSPYTYTPLTYTAPAVTPVATPGAVVPEYLTGTPTTSAQQTVQDILSGKLKLDTPTSPLLQAAEADILKSMATGAYGLPQEVVDKVRAAALAKTTELYGPQSSAFAGIMNELSQRGMLRSTEAGRLMAERSALPAASALAGLESELAQKEFELRTTGRQADLSNAIVLGQYTTELKRSIDEGNMDRLVNMAKQMTEAQINEAQKLGMLTYEEAVRVEEARRAGQEKEGLLGLEEGRTKQQVEMAEAARKYQEDRAKEDQQLSIANAIYTNWLNQTEQAKAQQLDTLYKILGAYMGTGDMGVSYLRSMIEAQDLERKSTMDVYNIFRDIGETLDTGGKEEPKKAGG